MAESPHSTRAREREREETDNLLGISALARPAAAMRGVDELRKTLLEASEKLKLICPVASETIVETTGLKSAKQRILIHELHSQLADARLGGPICAFKSMWKIINEETLALATSKPPPSAFELIGGVE